MPPFTRKCDYEKRKRLNTSEVKDAIAKLRIHVEIAIEGMRHFKLLNQTMPMRLKPVADQILKVAAIVYNLKSPLVKN